MIGGNHIVNTTQLQSCIERLEVICNNMTQVRGRLENCLVELKQYWTSLDANDRNTYVREIEKRLVELDQFIKLLLDFNKLLVYYKEGYEEQAKA